MLLCGRAPTPPTEAAPTLVEMGVIKTKSTSWQDAQPWNTSGLDAPEYATMRQEICSLVILYHRPTDGRRDPYRRRFFASVMLRSPGGLGGGIGSDRGAGGSSFARIALKLRTRGDSG